MEIDNSGKQVLPINKTLTYQLFMHGEAFNDTQNECFSKPFLISQHPDIVDKHMGQYPVIYMRFKFIDGLNDAEAMESFKTTLHRAYKPHRYMMNVLKAVYKSIDENETVKKEKAHDYFFRFKRILEETETNEDYIASSLDFLCKMLYRQHRKRVIVLIDDYEWPFYKLLHSEHFLESDIKYVMKYIEKAISPILEPDYPYVERAIITSTYRIIDALGPIMKSIPDYTLMNNPWLEYFGITTEEQLQLCQYMGKNDEQCQNAYEWYMGYKSAINDQLNLGQAFSMAHFLATNNSEQYLYKNMDYDYMFELMRIKLFRDLLDSLVNKNTVTMDLGDLRFNKTDFRRLKRLVTTEPDQQIEQSTIDLVFSYLCASGYLTFSRINGTTKAKIWVPNKETLGEICRKLKAFYFRFFGINYTYVDKLTGNLGVYVMNQMQKPPPRMESCLHHLFKSIKIHNTTHSNLYTCEYYKEVMHAVLNFISMKLRMLVKLRTRAWKEGDPPVSYMVGIKNNHGVIIAAQYNQTVENLMALAKEHKHRLQKYKDLEYYKFIAIALDTERTVSMMGDCEYLNDKGLLYMS